MDGRKTATLATPVLGALGMNAVPVVGLVWGNWPLPTAMVVYLAEALLVVACTALRLRLLGPERWKTPDGKLQSRAEQIQGFLTLGGAFWAGAGVFLIAITVKARMLDLDLTMRALGPALLWLAAIQLLGIVADLLILRRVAQEQAETWIAQGLGRVFLIYLAVFAGVFLAIFFQAAWFVVPFMVLKLIVDVGGPLQFALSTARGLPSKEML